jgi:hypothetical protein
MEFTASIHTIASNVPGTFNPCVMVPAEIVVALLAEAGRQKPPVQVKARLNGSGPFDANVVNYGGAFRLYLNGQMRREAGLRVGDSVRVSLRHDPAARRPPMPATLRRALNADPPAKAGWRLLPRSRRKEILAYLNSLKTPAALERNVAKVVRSLQEQGRAPQGGR